MPVFTTRSAPFRQTTSALFHDRGNPGEVPCPVSDSNVSAISANFSAMLSFFSRGFGLMTAAVLRKSPVTSTGCISILQNLDHTPIPLSPIPDLVVSFDGKELTSSVETKMNGLNFRKEASGRNRYYRGHLPFESIGKVLGLNPSADTLAPYGAVNIKGLMVYNATDEGKSEIAAKKRRTAERNENSNLMNVFGIPSTSNIVEIREPSITPPERKKKKEKKIPTAPKAGAARMEEDPLDMAF